MDAIERVEVSVRTRMVNAFSLKYGPFGHLSSAALPGLLPDEHSGFLWNLRAEAKKSREPFVDHYRTKYTAEADLPLWMAAELMSFGAMLTFYRGIEKHVQTPLAAEYQIQGPVLHSWLRTLSYIRNMCAHHARTWDRVLAIQPFIPRRGSQPQWYTPVDVSARRNCLFSVLTVLRYMLTIVAPQSHWQERLEKLLAAHPDIPLYAMGLPANWKDCPIWQKPT